jgi:hypothetical protein
MPMPTIPKYLNIAAPLQAAAAPPACQREAVALGALFLVRPDADELATFSTSQCRDLAAMAMRWFPSWEPYRPAHECYRRAFKRSAGRYELTGPWAIYDLTQHGHTLACAVPPSLRMEDAWFTSPFVRVVETNEDLLEFYCCAKIIDAFVELASRDQTRWLIPAIEQKG